MAESRAQASGETQEDSEKEMWTIYMNEVEEHDKRIADTWKEDANALVVFTGLFSAVVAAFIIESYKKLSPDSGDETVVLLRQISQQLANSTNGNFPSAVKIQQPPPSTLLICVNAMWLTSLVFSIASALFATLLQQWARRYIQKPQIPREPNKRARVRLFLYDGTEKFKMRPVVEIAPTPLHASVLLFFVGLAIFFVPINKVVGIAVSVAVGLFVLAYLTLTILPCIKHNCPYRTPMTVLYWYTFHAVLFSAARCVHWVVVQLHGYLVSYNLAEGHEMSRIQQVLVKWYYSCGDAVKKHRDGLKHGVDQSTIKAGENLQAGEEHRMLIRLLNQLALVDKSKLRNFVASIPINTIGQLVTPPIESGKMALRVPLLALVRSGAIGRSTAGHDEGVYRRSLFVGLEAVRHVIEALINSNVDREGVVLHDVRVNFANITLMREMWANGDIAIRLISRSICALLARRLMRKQPLEQPELAWLQDVTGQSSNVIYGSRGDFAVLDRMNLGSFVDAVIPPNTGDLPSEHVASFERTLAFLMGVLTQADTVLNRTDLRSALQNLVQQMEGNGDEDSFAVRALHQMQ